MKITFVPALLFLALTTIQAQTFVPNYDETRVPLYTLPDPLRFENGEAVASKKDWERRREEIFGIFEREVFGVSPDWDGKMQVTEISRDDNALGGKAVRQEVKVSLMRNSRQVDLYVLTYLPKQVKKAPIFVGLNFYGNHALSLDEAILVTESWVRDNNDKGYQNNRASAESRGNDMKSWPLEDIVGRGYGLASLYYGDIDPDFDDGFENGVHALYDEQSRNDASWGSIAAWAWGLSRVVDYLESVKEIDKRRIAVIGHSRLGKAALWAAAVDSRFAMAISNNSGCGGAALSRRKFGETVARINTSFPHWFNDNFLKYNDNEDNLPIDQHQLISIIAPKPVYIASGEDDLWADPKGEFLSGVEATPVYRLLGKEGMPVNEMPLVNQPVMGTVGYHVRTGGHGLLAYDWQQYLDFADKHWK